MTSSIYNGTVVHKRFKPKIHFFKYRVFSLLIDLSELNYLDKTITFFSYNKFNLISFYEKDHGNRDHSSLLEWIKKNLNEETLVVYKNAYEIEMYINTTTGFEGGGDISSKFGLEIQDELILIVNKERFTEETFTANPRSWASLTFSLVTSR